MCFFISIFFLFFSCKKEETVFYSTDSVIRGEVEFRLGSLEWTDELDSDGLESVDEIKAQSVSEIPSAQNSPSFFPAVLGALQKSKLDIYPVYSDFGVLDVSKVPPEVVDFVSSFLKKTFLTSPSSRKVSSSFLDSEYPFLSIYMNEEVKKIHKVQNWYIAEPELVETTWEIPVRLLGEKCHTDIIVFICEKTVKKKKAYFVEQVYFGDCVHE